MGPVKASISLLILQIQVKFVTCSKTTVVTVSEGHSVDLTCEYPPVHWNSSKFFFRPMYSTYLIRTHPYEHWVTNGRFSLYDNLTAGQFVVHMDRLDPEDSGTYWCGVKLTDDPDCISVIQLYVTQTRPGPSSSPNIIVDKRNLPLFVTVVSCLAALLIVFLFTLCLVFTVRNRKQTHQRARAPEMSSDYEVMKSGVLPEQKLSTVGLEDHSDVDGASRVSQYQELDVSTVEEHVYHDISSKPIHL